MPSDAMQKLAARMRAANSSTSDGRPSLQKIRANFELQQSRLALPDDLKFVEMNLGGRPGCIVEAPNARADYAVLYLHGGGYIMGSLNSHKELMGRLSRRLGAVVYGLDYRLAPENPWPAGLEDAFSAWNDLLELGVDPTRALVAGDSAGGGLAAAMLLRLKEDGVDMPAGAALFSPWVDLTCSGQSYETRAQADPMFSTKTMRSTSRSYCGAHEASLPLISPIFADLSGISPLLIQVGDAEILLDDARRLHDAAVNAGVNSTIQIFDDAFHVFQAFPALPEASEALDQVAEFSDACWGRQ